MQSTLLIYHIYGTYCLFLLKGFESSADKTNLGIELFLPGERSDKYSFPLKTANQLFTT